MRIHFILYEGMGKEEMTKEDIKTRLNEIEFYILKNPTADFVELTRIIFERIDELRALLEDIKE